MQALIALDPVPTPIRRRDPQQSAPVVEALRTYLDTGTVSFSTPGHKGGRLIGEELRELLGTSAFRSDIWLNMSAHDSALGKAEQLAAETWGADDAYYLVNGSSSGNHALLLAHLQPGDTVVVGRDVHMSVLTGLILSGAQPVFVAPRLHPRHSLSLGLHPDDVAAALEQHPEARLVIVTSPSYHGVSSDLGELVRVAHEREVPVFVDEAWGAHFRFHPSLPQTAMEAGADAAVLSLHKTLPAMGQGSLLVVQGNRIDRSRLKSSVRMTQSTSRSIPILASLDSARRQLSLQGWALMELTLALAALARQKLSAIPGIELLDHNQMGVAANRCDPTRLIIDVQALGLTGYQVETMLRDEHGIAPEMSDHRGLVCIISVADNRESVDCLVNALSSISTEAGPGKRRPRPSPRSVGEAISAGQMVMTPREAFFSRSIQTPLPAAIGAIAAEAIVPYPPGIPVLIPGERICWTKLMYLAQVAACGATCAGAADPRLLTIRVVDER